MSRYVEWFDVGFESVISVTPPGAPLSPRSKLTVASLGKVPGRRNKEGLWGGYDWLRHETDRVDCARWERAGANLGLRTEHFPALDLDVTDATTAKGLCKLAHRLLGFAPERIGRAPKRLLLYRTDTPFTRMRLWLSRGEGDTAEHHLIEFLGVGQQAVVEGQHPATGNPYRWTTDPLDGGAEGLSSINVSDADAYLDAASEWLQDRGWRVEREGTAQEATEREIVSPASLSADLSKVRAAMTVLPNSNEAFPGRGDYLRVGYAVKAALPDHPEEAFHLWWDWCQRWEGNERSSGNTLAQAEADWQRMQAPFSVGAPWLFDLARDHGYSSAVEEFADTAVTLEVLPMPEIVDRSGALPYTDAWLAGRFLSLHGDKVRHCADLGGWMRWDGQRWAKDTVSRVHADAGRAFRAAGREALDTITVAKEAEAAANRCGSHAVLMNAMRYASMSPLVSVSVEAFDLDPWALNTPGGIIDLKTGILSPSDPARLFTRCTSVTPDASIPPKRWKQFLKEVTGGDDELARYLQRLAGYSLTGSTREHVMGFLYGPGGNGKGTFLNTLLRILGSYAQVAAMDTFTASRFDRHPAELAALFGARLVTAQETQEGRSWDEAKIKAITGGDPISARFMRQDFFVYQPQFTLLFSGNHRPRIQTLDDAMRRRFHLIPFDVRPAILDKHLDDVLRLEFAGILAWMIEGCLSWQRDGLEPPLSVRAATEEYFADEDPMGRWMQEQVIETNEGGVETRDLFAAWRVWCGERNEKVGTERTFSQAFALRGPKKWLDPVSRRHGYACMALRPNILPPSSVQQDFDIPLSPPKRQKQVLH